MNQVREAILKSAVDNGRYDPDGGERTFCFAEDFVGFSGHFPDYPVLPAILQVLTAQLVAEGVIGSPVRLVALERAKFLRRIRPGEPVRATVACNTTATGYHCRAELSVDAVPAAQFVLQLG